jgi:hypothetical protein
MKRIAIGFLLLLVLVFSTTSDARRRNNGSRRTLPPSQGVVNIPCDPSIDKIEECPDRGCSNGRAFDPLLNERKNIRTLSNTPIDKDYSYLHDRPNPGSDFMEGGNRDALSALGEGQMIRVVAYAVRVSRGSSESCNCQLTTCPTRITI